MNVLLWLAWAVALSWIGREVYWVWRDDFENPSKRSPYSYFYPEHVTFLYVMFGLLGSAGLRVWVDHTNFYPRSGGFWFGYTEAQLLCGLAWFLCVIYSSRWGFAFVTSRNSDVRWTLGSLYAIFFLVGTSLVLSWVFQIPLGDGVQRVSDQPQ